MHIKLESSTLKWADAQQNCQQQDGNLIRITTKDKWDYIILYLKGRTTKLFICPDHYMFTPPLKSSVKLHIY